MNMQCFARWFKDEESGLCFRDQTILQFGNSWDLLASFILLNPGSALPKDMEQQDELLGSKSLPYFISPKDGHYYNFTIDRLMRDVIQLYKQSHAGGVIKIYNLFNLKNQHSGQAVKQFKSHSDHDRMLTIQEDVCYGRKPVIIATGRNAFADAALTTELKKHISLASADQLYALSKIAEHQFAINKAEVNDIGLIKSYHLSYTFKYGNQTVLMECGQNG